MSYRQPYERACTYCGLYYTPSTSKQIYCQPLCGKRHGKELAKRRRLRDQGFLGVFPIMKIHAKQFYTIDETAEILAVSDKTIQKWIKTKTLKILEVDQIVRIPFESINLIIKNKYNNESDTKRKEIE